MTRRWKMPELNVLVLCEFSGTVRDAFTLKGHHAISCDLLPTETPGQHYQGDVWDMLNNKYDLIVAHPPCTALTVAGNRWYGEGQLKYHERLSSAQWTEELWNTCCTVSKHVCFENPIGVLTRLTSMPKAVYVQPYHFGHKEQKKTGLFLHNLPPLVGTEDVYKETMLLPKHIRERVFYLPPSPDRWKVRSTTFKGIANAMADQWGSYINTKKEMEDA
jgi:hypothetical protein